MKTEFEFINALRAKSKVQSPKSKVRIGIGDDCAVIRQNSKTDLVITTDLLVEDIDFRLDWTTPEFIGHKALVVSLSDVAAMGAKPTWAMVSIGVPHNIWQGDFVERFYKGWFRLAEKYDVQLVGGDVSKTPDKIVIDSIVAGEVTKNRAILRSGAKVGDLILVTGELGGAAVGLMMLDDLRFYREQKKKWINSAEFERLRLRQIRPQPRVEIGQIISKEKLATAMLDISDGVSSDLTHLCRESRTGAIIDANKVPIDKNIPADEFDALSFALNGGEDFELLFTVSPKKVKKLTEHLQNFSLIGEIVEENQGLKLLHKGEILPLESAGFCHF